MKLTWDAQARAWVSDVSRAGPAGTASISVGGVWVEFDRVDGGRIVSVMVPADPAVSALLGVAAEALRPPDLGDDEIDLIEEDIADIDISLHDSPLWDASRRVSLAAELAEDAARLEPVDPNAATVAYLELAQVLEDLGPLAPAAPASALERALALRLRLADGRLALAAAARDRFNALMAALLSRAPAPMRRAVEALAQPTFELAVQR